ncbi:NACHT domain-containing protein [Streptomyces sp. NPDC052020]|uniref:NACHT domain-containing protein n=1 Tax=Streptomyces sp. NPDC052020 TaxID=3155677 RepID=UPI0034493DB5
MAGLKDYLAAAAHAAREHPYPGVVPGTAPPLTAVYLRQTAIRSLDAKPAEHDRTSSRRSQLLPADRILGQHYTCAILGAPGSGKSSLLRTQLAALAVQWQQGGTAAAVPVLVPAAALPGRPLPEALARAVTAELSSFGLVHEVPADFFATKPHPGIPWLVLVDGLDEITDPNTRCQILRSLAAISAGDHQSTYRFIVASRPLPQVELDLLGEQVPRYELQPFGAGDLPAFARGWFQALRLPEVDEVTRRFIRSLDHTGLSDLARTPLMATMLCQLYAARPDEPLPGSRGQLYRRFVELLHERQHTAGLTGIRPQTRAALERYGEGAVTRAHDVLDRLPDLLGQLAVKRSTADDQSALSFLAEQSLAQGPPGVPDNIWKSFLEACLRRSGLLTFRAGDFGFLHQTLLEYLAAVHVARDADAHKKLLEIVLNVLMSDDDISRWWQFDSSPWWQSDGIDTGDRSGIPVLGLNGQHMLTATLSFVGFLFDSGDVPSSDAVEVLERLATRGGLRGCRFIAAQARVGTGLPQSVVHAAVTTLDRMARDTTLSPASRADAMRELARIGGPLSRDALDTMTRDVALGGQLRLTAAGQLDLAGDPRGKDLLAFLARDPSLDAGTRVRAASWLADDKDPLGADLLDDLARSPDIDSDSQHEAAHHLAMLRDSRSVQVLDRIANDTSLNISLRREAACDLAGMTGNRGVYLLYALVRDSSLHTFDRIQAAHDLVRLESPHAATALTTLAYDTTLGPGSREYVVSELATAVREPHVTDLLRSLAHDTALNTFVRIQAATELAERGDKPGADLLNTLVYDENVEGLARAQAAYALSSAGDSRATDALHAIAQDTTLEGMLRLRAAAHLVVLGHVGMGSGMSR